MATIDVASNSALLAVVEKLTEQNNILSDSSITIKGDDGKDGVIFTPHVSADGTLSWTNDGGLENPEPVNIVGNVESIGEIVQVPGDSELAVMSQKAVTEYVPKVATRNLANLTFEYGAIDGGKFKTNTTSQDRTASRDYIAVSGGESYTISCEYGGVSGLIYIHEYSANNEDSFIKYTRIGNINGSSMPATIQLDVNCAFIRIHVYTPTAPTTWKELVPNKLQIELGTEATNYISPFVIVSDEIDDEELAKRMQEKGVIPNAENYIDTLPVTEHLPESAWEYGSLNNADGTEAPAQGVFRIRTKRYIQLHKGDVITSTKDIGVYEYDAISGAYIWTSDTWTKSYTIQNDCFVRILINNYNSEDIATNASKVTINHNSDSRIRFIALPLDDLRKLSEEIAKCEIEKKATESPIPVYYTEGDYLKNKVSAIRDYISASNGNYDVFFFCTDMHWTINAKKSPYLIDYLASKIHINRLFTGGDLDDGINMDVIKELNSCFKGSLYNASGNHEYQDYFREDGQRVSKTITGGEVWQYLDGQMTDAVVGDATKNYYYVDNITQKMRYIILASFTEDMVFELGAEQEAWLRDTALNMPDGYTAVVFTHSMGTENTSNNTLTIHGAGTTITNICDASDANIACIIAGHTHADIMAKTPTKQIPIFVTTCDKFGHWIDNGVDREPWLSNRVEGTITEQAFDVFIVNKTNREINAVRIGCPAIDGTETGLEVRTQPY